MKRCAALLSLTLVLSAFGEEQRLVKAVFSVRPELEEAVRNAEREAERDAARASAVDKPIEQRQLITFFERLGVPFPPGSSANFDREKAELMVVNTLENMEVLERLFVSSGVYFVLIESDLSFVAFDWKTVETAGRTGDGITPTGEQILALWAKGEGRLRSASKIVTTNGVNGQVWGARELFIPEPPRPPASGDKADDGDAGARDHVAPFAPEVREVGTLLNLTATLMPGSGEWDEFNVTLAPELSDGPAGRRPETPIIFANALATTVQVLGGKPLVVGGAPNRDRTEMVYMILTVRRIHFNGRQYDPHPLQRYLPVPPAIRAEDPPGAGERAADRTPGH